MNTFAYNGFVRTVKMKTKRARKPTKFSHPDVKSFQVPFRDCLLGRSIHTVYSGRTGTGRSSGLMKAESCPKTIFFFGGDGVM